MKYKNGIIALTAIVSVLCFFFFSFTWVADGVRSDARTYATKGSAYDKIKYQRYIDSLWNKPVYPVLGFTLKDVVGMELHKGLDLQGGLHMILEVSPADILSALAGNTKDPDFVKALEEARKAQTNSQQQFQDIFYDKFSEVSKGRRLAAVFSNAVNRDKISSASSDAEVKRVLNAEIEQAIDRAYLVIRSRIDQFGLTNPNIQRLPGTSRIQVELPAIDNPERARKLVSSAAKLEFCEVYAGQEYQAGVVQMQALLDAEDKAKKSPTASAADTSKAGLAAKLNNAKPTDSTAAANGTFARVFKPALAQNGGLAGLQVSIKDTSEVNRILNRPEVRGLFPSDLVFAWDFKADDQSPEILNLNALRRPNGVASLGGDVITDASYDVDQIKGSYEIGMKMNPEGARRWKNLTGSNIGRQVAIVLDNLVYSAPVVQGEIPNGISQITGNFTVEEAKDLSSVLKSGKLPAPTRIVEEAFVGPSLGQEAISQGYLSMFIGLCLVVLFMFLYYGSPAWVANVSLLFNVFFLVGVLVQSKATFTLPGIAGIVLTMGMAVDANVLINERIKEELHSGKGLLAAINEGYEKAWSAIIDGNITTIIIGIILWLVTAGSVQGFGVTLTIGLITSVFTSFFISHILLDWAARKAIAAGKEKEVTFETFISKGLFKGINFDFIGKRKYSYWFSWALIAIGLVVTVMQGGFNLGVDFKGGRSYVVQFNNAVEAGKVKDALSENFKGNSVDVKTFETNDKLKITTSYLVENESLEASQTVRAALEAGLAKFAAEKPSIISESKVGSTIADDILQTSFLAVFYALICIFIYILIRFRKWQYSLGGVIALLHDALVVLSMMSILRLFGFSLEVDQVFIAAVLTVIGYSINDTVVVFDRIREYLGPNPDLSNKELIAKTINDSINQTMSRTVMTATTVFLVVTVLLFFGGDVLRGFSFAMFIGCVFGTYSSIFVAAPIVVDFIANKKLAKDAKSA
jgi:SecD/SecF fusion protein